MWSMTYRYLCFVAAVQHQTVDAFEIFSPIWY